MAQNGARLTSAQMAMAAHVQSRYPRDWLAHSAAKNQMPRPSTPRACAYCGTLQNERQCQSCGAPL
jgi:hypothetical protein